MVRWFFAVLALMLGVMAIKKEALTMRFPQSRFYSAAAKNSAKNQASCQSENLEGWFKELRRTACYPLEFSGRLDGIWGPERPMKNRSHE